MNEITIRKGTIMKRTTVLVLLALACLMAMPAIAQARYRDGMNLYQYVRSNSPRYVDWNGAQATEPGPQPAKPAPKPKPQYGLIVRDAGLRTALMNLMAKMCPCFDYKEEGEGNVRIAIVDKYKADGDKPSRDFCCCYYKHLPACNLLLIYRNRGGYPGSLYPQKQDFPTSRGAAWRNEGGRHVEMQVDETGDTFAHEMTHGVFGHEEVAETAVDAGVALIQGKPDSYKGGKPLRKVRKAMFRMLKELVTDHAGCNRRSEFGKKPTDATVETEQAMNQFKEFQRQAQSIADRVK